VKAGRGIVHGSGKEITAHFDTVY